MIRAEPPTQRSPAEAPWAAAYHPPENARELLQIDEPIRRYFTERISPRSFGYGRLREIVDIIVRPDGLDFTYEPGGTFDVRETFRRRGGNCVSFAFLVVAVAREFGLDASFQTVERVRRWERIGGLVVVVLHLNVRVTTAEGDYVIDPAPEVVPFAGLDGLQGLRRLRDETACAHFYSNIGFRHVLDGDLREALRVITLATSIDPKCASAWTNRAILQAQLGELAAAKISYERALRVDPRGVTALDGFVDVLRRLGTPEDLRQADKFERKARAARERNPYYQQELAQRAQARGDLATAEKYLRRAISLKADEPEFYAQRMAVLERLGRSDDARRLAVTLDKLRDRRAGTPVRERRRVRAGGDGDES